MNAPTLRISLAHRISLALRVFLAPSLLGLFAIMQWGCGSSEIESAYKSEREVSVRTAPAETTASEALRTEKLVQSDLEPGVPPAAVPPGEDSTPAIDADAETVASQFGMTAAQLQMKKQMLMDSGLTSEEIAKTLMMGGDPSSLFKDDAQSNIQPPEALKDLSFFRTDKDQQLKLADHIGNFNMVLVFTRGYFGGTICPFCTTQTAQLAASHSEFIKRSARVLIIYPGAEEHLMDFAAAVTRVDREKADIQAVKWPVLLDRNLSAVNLLDIAAELAQPSTFIIDKQGNVVFAYVGANRTDRPSVQALLDQLDALQ